MDYEITWHFASLSFGRQFCDFDENVASMLAWGQVSLIYLILLLTF
jgi:hypothetical protein